MRFLTRYPTAIFLVTLLILKLSSHPYDEAARELVYKDFLEDPETILIDKPLLLEKFLTERDSLSVEITFQDATRQNISQLSFQDENTSVEEDSEHNIKVCETTDIGKTCITYFRNHLYPHIKEFYRPDISEEKAIQLEQLFFETVNEVHSLNCIREYDLYEGDLRRLNTFYSTHQGRLRPTSPDDFMFLNDLCNY